MLKKFIERPVLSTVVSIILLILGGLSIFTLPISLFPDIAPPSILVSATYPGANAEVVARSVATPLEEAINGVENRTYMTSNSSNDGSMSVTVYFRQGTNADIVAVNVQNRVSKATSQIPAEVIQAGISTQKQQNSIIMFIGLYSTDTSYDETFLQNYAKINLIPKLQRIPGVADATPFGTKDYSMRIWLKPDRLVAYNLSPIEVTSAIKDQSLEAAPGRFGQSSKEVYEYVLKYKGKLNKNEDYENVIVKSNSDGSIIRLKDVARVEFGSYTYSSNSSLNGNPTTGIAIQQVAGSNANDILTEAEKLVGKFDKQLPKGLHTTIMFNSKEFLDASIEQVLHTLVEAFILGFIVVFMLVGFMKGPRGVLYREFGYTLAIAIFISAVNALTLSPALCAIFLKNVHVEGHEKKGFSARFFAVFNVGFKNMTEKYVGSLRFLFRHKWVTIAALIFLAGSAYYMMQRTPSGFIPTEDQGFILYEIGRASCRERV